MVRCETDIFHPNIDTKNTEVQATESNVCLDLFSFGEWKKNFGFENIVAGLVYLLYNPNLDSQLCSYYNFDLHVLDYARDDDESFKTKVQMYLRGEEVDGIKFSPDFLNEDNDRVDNYTVDNLDELGVDEETVEPGDSYEGCTMLTVENVELNDDDDNGMESETILVPREAAQCSAGMKRGVFKADLVFENNDDASDDGGLSMTFYFQAFYDRLWQLLPSLARLSLSNIFYRVKHSFIRSR